MKFTFTEETPTNIDELKKLTANKTDANSRLQAVEELGKWKCQKTIDVLWRLMINDLVYMVQEAAFLRLQAFGEDVKLPRKTKGNLIKQIDKKIEKLLKAIEKPVTFEDFVQTFQARLPEEFDVYKHDKKEKFDVWLKNIVTGFPSDLRAKINTVK